MKNAKKKGENGRLEPATHTITIGHRRENPEKPFKTVTEVHTRAEQIFVDVNREILRYDKRYAVDTNTRNGISASVMVEHVINTSESDKILLRFFPILISKGKSCPEKYGWMKFIETFVDSESNRGKTIAFIVDHGLDVIPNINSWSIPLFENFYLPQNITLLYSSADSAKKNDAISNWVIYHCHDFANKALSQQPLEEIDAKLQTTPNNEYFFSTPREFLGGIGKTA